MNPSGAPLRAAKYLIVTVSPTLTAFGPFLLMPRPASTFAPPVVITHSVIVPSGFFTSRCIAPCGFVNATLVRTPVTSPSCLMSYTPDKEWWACATPTAINPPNKTRAKSRLIMSPSDSASACHRRAKHIYGNRISQCNCAAPPSVAVAAHAELQGLRLLEHVSPRLELPALFRLHVLVLVASLKLDEVRVAADSDRDEPMLAHRTILGRHDHVVRHDVREAVAELRLRIGATALAVAAGRLRERLASLGHEPALLVRRSELVRDRELSVGDVEIRVVVAAVDALV